jgi:hypothetical protein
MSDITRAPAKADNARIASLANEMEMSAPSGGARRDRTDDLLLAKQALSQLSYGPFRSRISVVSNQNLEAGSLPITDHRLLISGVGGPGKI